MHEAGSTLPEAAHAHHAAIQPHLDRLPELAAMIGTADPAEFVAAFERECAFVTGQLVPHMEAIERTLYGQLERVMGQRHSMAPMREEHVTLKRLIGALCGYRASLLAGELSPQEGIGLRRVLYRLYSILKVHLAEEELYLGVLDHNLSSAEKDALAVGLRHATAEPL
jgi:hypothetical protein